MQNEYLSSRVLKDFASVSEGMAEIGSMSEGGKIGTPGFSVEGSVIGPDGKKIPGRIRVKTAVDDDGNLVATSTTFKPYGGHGVPTKEVELSTNASVSSASSKLTRVLKERGMDVENTQKLKDEMGDNRKERAERSEAIKRDSQGDTPQQRRLQNQIKRDGYLGKYDGPKGGWVRENKQDGQVQIGVNKGGDDASPTSATAGGFSGTVYVAGVKWTSFGGTVSDYLSVPFDGSQPSYTSEPTGNLPNDAEIYKLSQTYGDIHVTRVG